MTWIKLANQDTTTGGEKVEDNAKQKNQGMKSEIWKGRKEKKKQFFPPANRERNRSQVNLAPTMTRFSYCMTDGRQKAK